MIGRLGARPLELRLLALGLLVFAAGQMTLAAVGNRPAASVAPAVVALGAVFLAAHFWLAANGATGDEVLLPAAGVLTAISLTVVERLHPTSFLPQFAWV
ncbi:MAG TPA: hypothetical protein VIU62_10075, partial [Chloroflexota bacterium]